MDAIVIRNRRDELARVTAAVDRFAARHRLHGDVLADLQVVLSEILTNIVDYAYADDASHEITVRLRLTGRIVEATVEDDGIPFNPLLTDPPDLSARLNERRTGGLGIHFVRKLMSEAEYARVGNRNCLVLRRTLDG